MRFIFTIAYAYEVEVVMYVVSGMYGAAVSKRLYAVSLANRGFRTACRHFDLPLVTNVSQNQKSDYL